MGTTAGVSQNGPFHLISIPPLTLFVSRFVVVQSLKDQSADAQSSLFRTKIVNLGINQGSHVACATFNCVFCNMIADLTFQMRKVWVTRN